MARFYNITIGMNKILLFGLLLLFSGCMAFAPKSEEPVNLTKEDFIGKWEYYSGKSMTVVDTENKDKRYENARIVVYFYPDNTFEQVLIQKDQKTVFHSKWNLAYHKNGVPNFSIEKYRFIPEDSVEFMPPTTLEVNPDHGNSFYICHTGDPDDGSRCLGKEFAY